MWSGFAMEPEVQVALITLIGVLFTALYADRKRNLTSFDETMEQLEDENLRLWRYIDRISPCPSCSWRPDFGPSDQPGDKRRLIVSPRRKRG